MEYLLSLTAPLYSTTCHYTPIMKNITAVPHIYLTQQVEFMSGMGNSMVNSFLEYHVPKTWLKPSHLEPREYRDSYVKVRSHERTDG